MNLHCRCSACSPASSAAGLQHDARWSLVMNIYAQAVGGAYHRHYSSLSKQAGAFRVHSSFDTCFTSRLLQHSLRLSAESRTRYGPIHIDGSDCKARNGPRLRARRGARCSACVVHTYLTLAPADSAHRLSPAYTLGAGRRTV